MYLLKYRGKLLFHREICDYPSRISTKELDIKKDKSLVKRLFGRLRIRSSASKAGKIRRILSSILEGQRTLPEILHGAVNHAIGFLRRGLFKVHKKTNTRIDYSGIELPSDLETLYTLQDFKGRLEDMFRVLEVSGLLDEAGILQEDTPFFNPPAARVKRGRGRFTELYSELEENPCLARQCGFDGYVPSDRSFMRFRGRALPQLLLHPPRPLGQEAARDERPIL